MGARSKRSLKLEEPNNNKNIEQQCKRTQGGMQEDFNNNQEDMNNNTSGDKQQCKRTNTRGTKHANRFQLKNSQNSNL
jgi:hypothetical protein